MKNSNVANFSGNTIYIGLDVHKSRWSVTTRFDGCEFNSYSMDPNPKLLMKQLNKVFPGGDYKAVYEAGFSGFWIQRELHELGINCIIINPADIPTKDKERKRKTDVIDSRKLASTLEAGLLEPIFVPSLQQEADRSLLRYRSNIVKDSSRTKNRIRKILTQQGIRIPDELKRSDWSKKFISWLRSIEFKQNPNRVILDNLLESLEQQRAKLTLITHELRKLSRTDSYRHNYKLLNSSPGIGLVGAMTILTEIGSVERFTNLDRLAAYCGLIPNTSSSGENQRSGKNTKRGNQYIKVVLIEAAWVAIRKDPDLRLAFSKLSRRMKKQKAIIIIAKKLLARIRAILLHQTPYRINSAV